MTSVKERAYAKINLFLDVLTKREDGFHEINTVMHTVSLCDEITVSILSKGHRGVRLCLDGNKKLPTDGKNLAYSAAKLFLDRAMIDCEVGIKLVKRIPVAAGLAGGSTDAAAVLRAMNKLFSKPLSDKVLLELASTLGSDVPYCLLGGTALCSGRGEKIRRLNSNIRLHAVVAVANEYVSTPKAYAALDALYSDFDGSVAKNEADRLNLLLSRLSEGAIGKDCLYNVFEAAVLPTCSGASALKCRLEALDAYAVLMSGSGPSVFGLFDDLSAAERAASALKAEGFDAFVACTV